MNRNLFLSILALDSYNRGYHPGLEINESDNLKKKLGNSEISAHTSDSVNSAARKSDFYALAYDWNGETIISYRGTDNLLANANANTGYGLGAGDTSLVLSGFGFTQLLQYAFGTDFGSKLWFDKTGATPTSQSDLAIKFYEAVTGKLVHNAATPTSSRSATRLAAASPD